MQIFVMLSEFFEHLFHGTCNGGFIVHRRFVAADVDAAAHLSPCERLRRGLQRCVVVWLALGCLLAGGCGSEDGLAKVKGVVTMKGQPLSDATVEFRPEADGEAPSSGQTDADGRYELEYTFDTPGAVPGEHVVSIRTSGTFFDEQGNERERGELVPVRYNARSELRRTVAPGRNTIDFDL